MPQLCYALATAYRRLEDTDTALDLHERAVETGWRDANWLEADPEMATLKGQPPFQALVSRLRRAPAERFEGMKAASVP